MRSKKEESVPRRKTTFHIPMDVWKDLHLIIIYKYGGTHGHIGESFIEALNLWIIKEKKIEM
ncbi:hypothetical protein ES705_39184 [subsurface metagenome]